MRLGMKQLGAGGGILALLVAGLAGGALASRVVTRARLRAALVELST